MYAFDLDLAGVVQADRQLIAAQFQFDGVAHGCDLAQCDFNARCQAHVQKVTAKCALAAYRADPGVLADGKFG